MNYKEQLKELRAWDARKDKAVEQALELRKELERAGENLARIVNRNKKE